MRDRPPDRPLKNSPEKPADPAGFFILAQLKFCRADHGSTDFMVNPQG